MTLKSLIALAATLLALPPALAQDAASCLPRLDAATADSARSTFAATVQSFNPRRPLTSAYAELLAEGMRQEFKLPPAGLLLPVFEADSIAPNASPSTKAWMAVPSMSVVFGVTITTGRITRIRRIAGASSVPFDASVMNALMMLDSSLMLPPLPESVGPEPLEISVAIARIPQRQIGQTITPTGVATPLFLVRSPAYPVTQRVVPGNLFSQFVPQPPTKRPDEAVSVRVLVMPDGTVDPASMQVTAYSSTGYIQSVFDMIPNWQFKPLMLNGCAVPALEALTFTASQGTPRAP